MVEIGGRGEDGRYRGEIIDLGGEDRWGMGWGGRVEGKGVKDCIEKPEKNITKKSKRENCKQKIKSVFSNVSFSI